MKAHLLLIGQIFEAIEGQMTDKKTGIITNQYVEVQVEQTLLEIINGKPKKRRAIEEVRLPIEKLDEMESSIGKYISIPYQVTTYVDRDIKRNMTAVYPVADEKYNVTEYQIFDNHPLEIQEEPMPTAPISNTRKKSDS